MMKIYCSFVLIVFTATGFHFTVTKQNIKNLYASIADPETNYKNYCGGCHGEYMQAFVDRSWKHGRLHEDLFKSIKYGYPDEGMPAFDSAFNDDEIRELVQYIRNGIDNLKRYTFPEKVTSATFETEELTIRLDTVATGMEVPWSMAFLPDGDMLVTERAGKLYRVKNKKLIEIGGVPKVLAQGQGGLMDVKLHPEFKKNRMVYLSYSSPKDTDTGFISTTIVSRFILNGNRLTQQKNIFEALPYRTTKHHYGSRLEFDRNGYLYITVGDRGYHFLDPQNIATHPGKMHRVEDDGTIPPGNPFVNTPGAQASIFSIGHRNQQGMVMHPKTGVIWTNEHGPRGGDEINIEEKASNYGWPVISYGINYNGKIITAFSSKEGMEQPQLYWLPSIGPSGMAFVHGNRYKGWEGDLLVGSLRYRYLNRCKMDGDKIVKQEMLFKNIGRVRDVRMGPDGYVYMSVESPGIVFRLTPVVN